MMLPILMFLVTIDATSLERRNRQDTIYTLRGKPEVLKAFQNNVGAAWTGGTAIDADPSDGTLAYWAYSDRTAVESRALIVPAIMSGFQLSFAAYREADQFPSERDKLDQLAVKCGVKIDPFFLTPKKTVEITLPSGADDALCACLSDGIRPLPVTTPRQRRTAI